MRLTLAVFIVLIMVFNHSGCAVDVGNPNPEGEQETAKLKVSFALVDDKIGQSFSLHLDSIEAIGQNASQEVIATMAPAVENVDLYLTGDDADATTLAEFQTVPAGEYHRLNLNLNEKTPFRYLDDAGVERQTTFEDSNHRGIILEESFSLAPGQQHELVVSLDVRQSLAPRTGHPGQFHFKPRGSMHRRKRGIRHVGSTEIAGATWVCAYVYGISKELLALKDRMLAKKESSRPGIKALKKPVFATAQDVIKDETPDCPNAFFRVPVVAGKYKIRHGPPATYDLRIFSQDKDGKTAFHDAEVGLVLKPKPTPKALRRRR